MQNLKLAESTNYCGGQLQAIKNRRRSRFPAAAAFLVQAILQLVETRKGRCGEWTNCFTLYCRAFGYESRLTISGPVSDPAKLPKWNFDGSSTGQAPGQDTEVILYPQAIFRDPFRRGRNILVICDTYTPGGEPIPTNNRYNAAKVFSHPGVVAEEPWFGIEQEYTLLQKDINWPLGWPVGGYPGQQGPYYCGVGADKAYGRDVVDVHYMACLYAGINISGINGEVMPGQV